MQDVTHPSRQVRRQWARKAAAARSGGVYACARARAQRVKTTNDNRLPMTFLGGLFWLVLGIRGRKWSGIFGVDAVQEVKWQPPKNNKLEPENKVKDRPEEQGEGG